MSLKSIKYLSIFVTLIFIYLSFTKTGVWAFSGVILVYLLVPIIDYLSPGIGDNMNDAEETAALKDKTYDYILYLMVPMLYLTLVWFFFSLSQPGITWVEITGRVLTMGIVAVSVGYNIGHELGHRRATHEQIMAKALLLVSLQMHFLIEHNRGHHKKVATEEDPASARRGETLYAFWVRSWIYSYISAWNLEAERLQRKGLSFYSYHNEMIRFEAIQILFVLAIYLLFGGFATAMFLIVAVLSKLQFETINYIEHYGLSRKKSEKGFKRVLPVHSWNSNQDAGRVLLFELTRHSDHHFKASRKYQILKNYEDVPQMPAGYPAMVMLSLFPPLWFHVVHKQIDKFKAENPAAVALA